MRKLVRKLWGKAGKDWLATALVILVVLVTGFSTLCQVLHNIGRLPEW
jgi:hypothetical protein